MIIWTVADAIVPTLGVAFVALSLLFGFLAPWSAPRKHRRAGRWSARITH